MLVSAIQLEVITRLGPGAGTTSEKLIRPIDEGNKRVYAKLLSVNEQLFYKSDTFNTILNRTEYTPTDGVPTDIKRILRLETRYAGQDKRYKCTKLPNLFSINKMDEISVDYQNKYQPRYYWFGNGADTTIGFVPTHDVAGDDYNKIWYLARPTEITSASQTPIVPEDSHFLIVEFALGVSQLIEDEDASAYFAFLKKFDVDVDAWIESEYPSSSEPKFTQDTADQE